MKRRTVEEEIDIKIPEDIGTITIEQYLHILQEQNKKYKEKYTETFVKEMRNHWEISPYLKWFGVRKETEEEAQNRIRSKELYKNSVKQYKINQKKQKEKEERKLLQKLKKKYGE